jgi:hypothetical protein
LIEPKQAGLTKRTQSSGVEFLDENGGGAGVRLKKPGAKKAK